MVLYDPEGESLALKQRSAALVAMLDASAPVVDRSLIREAQAEANRLGRLAHAARLIVAARVAVGDDPGVAVGRTPPIRRVRTDLRGKDLDPLRGRPCVTPELIRCVEYARDTFGPTVEASFRRAIEDRPYSQALAACCRGHLALLRQRWSYKAEGGEQLEASLGAYEASYSALAVEALGGQDIVTAAVARLANLERIKAEVLVGDDGTTQISGLIAAAVTQATDGELVVGSDGSTLGAPLAKAEPPVRVRSLADAVNLRSRTPRSTTRPVAPRVEAQPGAEAAEGFVYVVPDGPMHFASGGEILAIS